MSPDSEGLGAAVEAGGYSAQPCGISYFPYIHVHIYIVVVDV